MAIDDFYLGSNLDATLDRSIDGRSVGRRGGVATLKANELCACFRETPLAIGSVM